MAQMALDKVLEAEAAGVVRHISDYVNNYGHSPRKFVAAMAREHRTLQQSFTVLCLRWLLHLSEKKEHEYDLRNEASVKIARDIAGVMREKYGQEWYRLPLV